MDKYDPQKRIGLIVDEWGTWYDVEPGTNPGFLYQQNTLRDAMVAALNFHIFHRHADRVAMANIAQMINVLQAMILTDKEKMMLTPTYHVFEMFKVHQGGTLLPVELEDARLHFRLEYDSRRQRLGLEGCKIRAVYLSLVNTNPKEPMPITCKLAGVEPKAVTGRILTAAEMNAHNTFDAPDTVHPEAFTGAKIEGDSLSLTLPPKSVVMLELR